jgi:deferrochelatase/peroxidase EfeB
MADGFTRRKFIVGGASAAGAAGAVGALAACSASDGAEEGSGSEIPPPQYVAFHGEHQTGIVSPAPAAGLAASLRVVNADRDGLIEALQKLTAEARRLMQGDPYEDRDPAFPPLHTGTLGNRPPPTDLSVILSVGASLFDDRFGLADAKPAQLERMPFLANDRLVPELTHGDVLLTISADTPDATLFAVRQMLRQVRSSMILEWMVEGFNRHENAGPGRAPARNLLGFKDGTANLDPQADEVMEDHVWVADGDGEPAWAVGGSYHAVRTIRMFVEFWDRTPLNEQEALIGRRKESGAPMDGEDETDPLDFEHDPDGDVTPLDAHIRLANPRTPETERDLMLRRGFSYSRGFDNTGQLDQGLCFMSFQKDMGAFLRVSERLDGEPLEEYILPVGGGFFYAVPGVRDEDDWYARELFESTR